MAYINICLIYSVHDLDGQFTDDLVGDIDDHLTCDLLLCIDGLVLHHLLDRSTDRRANPDDPDDRSTDDLDELFR